MKIRLANSQASNPFRFAWLPLCGIAIWLGFPNNFLSLPCAALLWPICLAGIANNATGLRDALTAGWLASFAGCFAALYWLYMPLAEVGELAVPLALICAASIVCCIASQGAIFAAIVFYLKNHAAWALCILLPAGWYLLEILYARLAGFPWLPLSGALVQWPVMMQGAVIFGAYLWGALWLAPLFLVYFCFSGQAKPRPALVWAGFFTASMLAYGVWQLAPGWQPDDAQSSRKLSALIVEGNIDQNQKWDPAFQKRSLSTYIELTSQALQATPDGSKDISLLIWPETALTFFFQRTPDLAEETRLAVRNWRLPLLFGAPGVEIINGEDAIFNRAFLMNPEGRIIGTYDKEHLVPFGEYLPAWLDFEFLKPLLQGVGAYHPGIQTKPLHYDDLALGLLICYEGIFPWLAQKRVADGANVLVDISNDGWFGNSPAARQHLLLTALRSIEQNRWILRATNTGISAVIDAKGRITAAGGMFRAEYLNFGFQLENDKTPYHRYADYLTWIGLIIFCVLLFAPKKRTVR